MHPTSIGPYQILRELGRGGMGEVFLARDTRLDREVAIKALPAHLTTDPDRLARFQREAKVLASLNHPGIGAIYGLEEAGGNQYLILEFIEGETLAERVINGALPVDESLSIARQIAEALEVAHEKGVVHRDLKPGNIMVTPDGVVKILDFGLARTADGTPGTSGISAQADSPTIPSPAPVHSPTIPGAIMGTAGYMSPEQARGKAVDKRSDIFSFGCVVYEMLTGSGPFPGETVTDSLGAILHREPDWALLHTGTPARIRELLRSCLAKDRRNRLHDIGDARLELDRAISGHEWTTAVAPTPEGPKRRLAPLGMVCACAVAGATGWWLAKAWTPAAPVAPTHAFHVSTPVQDKPWFSSLAGISPDASFLVYTATTELPPESAKPDGLLMVRRLDRDESSVIEGTEGALQGALSPDGRWLAFVCAKDRARSRMSLKKIALESGRPSGKPETVCELPQGAWFSVCWASDREIVFSSAWVPTIYAVSASGGEPRIVLREDLPEGIENMADFRPLVPGKSFLATRWSIDGQKFKISTEAIDLDSGQRTKVLSDAGAAQYVPDGKRGYLLAMRSAQTSLIAVPFDLGGLRTVGEAVTVWSGQQINSFQLSSSGTLAMSTRSLDVSDRRLAWIDERGQPLPIPGVTRAFGDIVISPDGERVLVFLDSQDQTELMTDLWVQDLTRRTFTRIPIQGAVIGFIWSRDGQRITYGLANDGGFSIWERRSDGSGQPNKLYSSPDSRTLVVPQHWTPDGKTLAFIQVDMASDNSDAFLLEQKPGTDQWNAKPYLSTPVNEDVGCFSPDGKRVLFRSSLSGRAEWYVQSFTGDGEADARVGRVQLSTTGGPGAAWWSPDGKEIRFTDSDGQIQSVQVKTEPGLSVMEPKVLFSIKDLKYRSQVFAPDGRMMAVLHGESDRNAKSVGIVVNFLDELRARMAKAR
ncbi:MAG: protein kinase [Phycisphaerae bacterium]|nr:protein kinase [Phycisphaerae bacterium]